MAAQCLIIMGVAGSGKTSIGKVLATELGWLFYDADDYHSKENINKMATGIALTDENRQEWLAKLHALIGEHLARGHSMILACSALKQKYREQLAEGNPGTLFVYLKGNFDQIYKQIQDRPGQYMKAEMLASQFEELEELTDAFTVKIDKTIEQIVDEIKAKFHLGADG